MWLLQASDDARHCWSAARLRWAGEPWPQECSALVLGELGGSQHSWAALLLLKKIPSTAVFPLLVRLEQLQHQSSAMPLPLLRFNPSSDKTAQGTERSLPQGS